MVSGYFVTGTDTNAGKTFVTCAVARLAVAAGHRVFAFKPIESGCASGEDGRLIGADQELLAEAAGNWQSGALRGLYQLPLPAAPLVAAEDAGTSIDLDLVVQTFRRGRQQATFTLAEGAGGWRVPITAAADMETLAERIGLPVLLVARASLGTINHTLLSLEAIERSHVSVAAVVLSQLPTDDPSAAARNRLEICRRWPGSVILLAASPAVLSPLIPAV